MRISVYSLEGASMSFGLIQFEDWEIGVVRRALSSMSVEDIKSLFRSIGLRVREISVAQGVRVRDDWRADTLYISVFCEDSQRYWIEVLDEFMDFLSNEDVLTTVETMTRLIKAVNPKIELRGRRVLAITL